MNAIKRKLQSMSRRAISVFMSVVLFITGFAGTLAGVFMTIAGNPTKVSGLNRSYVVQNINLLPVDPTATNTRTTLKAGTTEKNSYKYADVTVNEDDTVDFQITTDNWHSNSSHASNTTSYVENFTIIGQKINLAENPWLMVRWSGSGRCNGRIYFTITQNGVEYGVGGTVISNATTANPYDFTSDASTLATTFLNNSVAKRPFSLPLSNIINDNEAGYKFTNQTQTDFNAGVLHDYTIDLYKYIKENYASYFPSGSQWKDSTKNYITVYMSCGIIASEAGKPLTAGTAVKWEQFAIGREVMNRPASMLPRSVEYMNVLNSSGDPATFGRVSSTGDGAVTFLNTSSSESVKFKWNLRRYFNGSELEALNVNATFSGGMDATSWNLSAVFGGRTTTYIEPNNYNYRGAVPTLQDLVKYYARSTNITSDNYNTGYYEAVIDFHKYLEKKSVEMQGEAAYTGTEYDIYFPDDSLIFVGDITLTLPAGGKITFNTLEFQVENEEIPATEANTVYPWASAESPNGLPPVGTPAYSTALNGASGTSYDWATDAKNAPLVKTKVDLLAMKTYSYNDWTDKHIETSTDTTDVTYTRKTDGTSIYSSHGQTDHTYYTLMRWGHSSDSTKWNRNYYTYLDVNATYHAPKYLYYSYEIEDTDTTDGMDPSAGFYFHFQNARRDRYTKKGQDGSSVVDLPYSYQYYLDHSGIGLNECSSMFYLGYTGTATDLREYRYGAEAILSKTKARTGVLDISSLWVNGLSTQEANGQYLKLENLRIYLGPNTKIKIHYFFVGSESLDESARGQIANEGGDAVPWSVSKADFDKWTNPDSSSKKFTYANKVDLIQDVRDRVYINQTENLNKPAGSYDEFPGGTINADGSVSVTVTDTSDYNTGYLRKAGYSFDYVWQTQVASSGDKASMRYLNYSVSAPAGMRWSIMFSEANGSSTQQRAIMTWCDSDATYNEPSTGYDIHTSAPAGKSYFRYLSTEDYKGQNPAAEAKPEYDYYWNGCNNTSWRLYSIPGSQSGCIDLRQVEEYFEWNNIISIYLVAYRDPRLVLDAGESPTVTFNYLYLTSTPISISSSHNAVGKPATTAGTIYNWGNTPVTAPTVTASTKLNFEFTGDVGWAWNYQIAESKRDSDISATPYLYYSYRMYHIPTGKTVKPDGTPIRVGIWIQQNNYTAYYSRSSLGLDADKTGSFFKSGGANYGFGKPAFIRMYDGSDYPMLRSVRTRGYASETGCIKLTDLTGYKDNIAPEQIRFVVADSLLANSDYKLVVDYLFLGGASSTTTTLTTSGYVSLKSAPKPVDFQNNLVASGTSLSGTATQSANLNLSLRVDLEKTPYLFYSAKLPVGSNGTFGLQTDVTVAGSNMFYRDAKRSDGVLISGGNNPASNQFMLQSESGCIDVREWYRKNGYTGNILNISQLKVFGCNITFNYLYFGAKADKTIDLIPSQVAGTLENGLATKTWVNIGNDDSPAASEYKPYDAQEDVATNYGTDGYFADGGVNWDMPNRSTLLGTSPVTKLKYTGDLMNDGFNDLWIKHTSWSQIYLRYGNITSTGTSNTFAYSTTGNNQMSGLMIDLNETPFLHFSFEQPETSRMSMVIQVKNYTSASEMVGKSAGDVRPWLSGYCPTSPAGQLICIVSGSSVIYYYKDIEMDNTTYISGNHGGVIDLRSWFTVTNGYSNVISVDSIRFYSHAANETYTDGTDLKVNHLYLSSSASAAYSVTFHTNKNDGNDQTYTQYVLKNANQQLVSDAAVSHFKNRTNYTFVGWYTDPECTEYFDINGTPLTGNIHLYARWIPFDDDDREYYDSMSEMNFLDYINISAAQVEDGSGKGSVAFDDEALAITNDDTSNPFKVTFPIHSIYDIQLLRSLFVGFDIDKTNGGFVDDGIYTGFDVTLNAQSVTPQSYSLVGDAFSLDFLTDEGLLTAAPYDRECELYTYLGVRDELPAVENTNHLFVVHSLTITVPVGVSAEIRYIKAANSMALQGNLDTCAPLSKTETFDLLENSNNDPSFVQTRGDIVYNQLSSKSMTYNGAYSFTQASIHGISDGYAHLGGLYNYTIDMEVGGNADKTPYLYISVDQPEDSNVTFAIYASFDGIVEGETSGQQTDEVYDIYTPKSVSVFSASTGGLVEKDYNTDATAYIPDDDLYFQGDKIIKINLYNWYKDALDPYRSNNTIYRVKILGVRFFTDDRSTDATVNYMFIGGKEHGDSEAAFGCYVEYPYLQGHLHYNPSTGKIEANSNANVAHYTEHRFMYGSNYKRGQTIYVSVEDLQHIESAKSLYNDPKVEFLGWVFSDIASGAGYTPDQLKDHLVWWNPNATNGNMYSDSNTGGSWSLTQVDGFIQNQKSVFFNFTTHNGNTQVITPVFSTATYTPTVKATVSGASASVSVVSGSATPVSGQANTWSIPFGSTMVLRATGSNFLGWYDDGVLVSNTKDYYLYVTQDVDVEARFGTSVQADTELMYTPQSGRSIVWLQSETGTAGSDFKLESVSGGVLEYYVGTTFEPNSTNTGFVTSAPEVLGHLTKSNIADTTGDKQIACYWNLKDSQIVRAVAPGGYHWEHCLADGTLVRVSASNVYEFITSTNIRLVAVTDSETYNGSIIIDEYVFDDNRTDPILRINGQVLCDDDEEVVTCGMVFTDYKGHQELPHYNCDSSVAVTAKAWNSTTGQYVVEFSVADSPEYVIRGFAIVRNRATDRYEIRYSQTITTVF